MFLPADHLTPLRRSTGQVHSHPQLQETQLSSPLWPTYFGCGALMDSNCPSVSFRTQKSQMSRRTWRAWRSLSVGHAGHGYAAAVSRMRHHWTGPSGGELSVSRTPSWDTRVPAKARRTESTLVEALAGVLLGRHRAQRARGASLQGRASAPCSGTSRPSDAWLPSQRCSFEGTCLITRARESL